MFRSLIKKKILKFNLRFYNIFFFTSYFKIKVKSRICPLLPDVIATSETARP